MMTRYKKFFSPKICTYNNNISKRWRVEYWLPGAPNEKDKRVCIYGNINRAKTKEARYERAYVIINSLPFKKEKNKDFIELTIEKMALYLKPKTISGYIGISNRVRNNIGCLESMTKEAFNNYLLNLKQKGLKNTTLHNIRITMHSLFKRCVEYGYTDYNPIEKAIRVKRQSVSLMYFSDEHIKKIKEQLKRANNTQLWIAIQFLFYCFIRPGEQRMMKIEWINFENRFIEIPGEHSKNGKTQKVAIPEVFYEKIKHLQDYPNNYFVLSKNGVPGPEKISTKWLNDEHRKILDKLKIRGNYSFYSWKHTGAVKAVKAGINLKDLQLQLRHHSLDMVNEYLKNLGVMDSEDLRYKFPKI